MNTLLTSHLKQYFGFDGFRPGQEQAITQLLQGESTLAIFPTGSGKSLCYQLTALQLPNLTLVVSPLIALMKDQLAFLRSTGIAAACIDSSLSPQENQAIMSAVESGETKILMVSVERFKNERFRRFIQNVAVSMLVVDEAHCISEWGHNFRPDYLKLPQYRQALNIPLVLLLTATATKQVKLDMAEKFAIKAKNIVQTGFYRKNLVLTALAVAEHSKNTVLLEQVNQQILMHQSVTKPAGIVYVTLQQSAEQVALFLQENGINASAYHAGFTSEKRTQIQDDFMANNIQVIVATIAFGMGIDKSDIRFVIHYDLPKSIENYSQEIGRAGRDNQQSHCITLANLDGLTTLENFIYADTPEQNSIAYVLDSIKQQQTFGRWEVQLLQLSNESNIKQLPLKTLLVQLELTGVIQSQHSYFADFKIKLLQPIEQILSRFDQDRQTFLSCIFNAVQFKKVWGSLDFERLLKDKSIERNRVIAALEYLQQQELLELETKAMTEVYNVQLNKLQETDLIEKLYHYFQEKEQKEIERISQLVGFFQLKTCLYVNLAQYFDDASYHRQLIEQKGQFHCMHCSVCHGKSIELTSEKVNYAWPTDEELKQGVQSLDSKLEGKLNISLSLDSYCRFFAGLSSPAFSRNKIRQLPAFGLCHQHTYQAIRDRLKTILPS
ncbi:RecQ family ATP-dependent DNA helicase [Litorilituus lipolyticus]|uniref:DNA 3'-5' helicase n=1 Tax=Litorilituus lipolyticus TaxID=2491017 RepID=A0A502L3M7_9GAMM|nr:RecQ family ATP-dependent DNA helicase [Litorilituus lipolyticus]TPH18610.1 ATP-dependent DNA helicase RecQ [Litorilituus lipolyticus]